MTKNQNDSIDELLSSSMLTPPDNFTEAVLSRIIKQQSFSECTQSAQHDMSSHDFWPSLAVAASAVLGVFQVIGFIAGIWIPLTAG